MDVAMWAHVVTDINMKFAFVGLLKASEARTRAFRNLVTALVGETSHMCNVHCNAFEGKIALQLFLRDGMYFVCANIPYETLMKFIVHDEKNHDLRHDRSRPWILQYPEFAETIYGL